MKRFAVPAAILCFGLAVAVFVFAEGMRRWYSGIFFLVLGAVLLMNAGLGRFRTRTRP